MTGDILWAGDSLQADAAYDAGERRSECTLCFNVVRCLHVAGDDRIVTMVERERWLNTPGHKHYWPSSLKQFQVLFGVPTERGHWCPCGFIAIEYDNSATADTRAEADRAFARFEAILMGRDPDDPRDDAPPTLQDEARWRADDDRWHDRQQNERRGER